MVPAEGVEPTHPHGYQILSLARLPIPPHRHTDFTSVSIRKLRVKPNAAADNDSNMTAANPR